jgi:hypothetical protein
VKTALLAAALSAVIFLAGAAAGVWLSDENDFYYHSSWGPK